MTFVVSVSLRYSPSFVALVLAVGSVAFVGLSVGRFWMCVRMYTRHLLLFLSLLLLLLHACEDI